jgi:hypothetical protein
VTAKHPLSSDNDIRVQVVTTAEQFLHVIAVRAICFMEDTGLSADQAIDGNDYQATHILAYAKREPIGATRIRWFRDFAKIERTAFRPAFRSTRILRRCSNFIYDHVAKKGYQVLVTHAEPQYALIWEKVFGFERAEGRPAVVTEGHEPYIELIKRLPPSPDAITLEVDPKFLFRIEGHWETPSAFETGDE